MVFPLLRRLSTAPSARARLVAVLSSAPACRPVFAGAALVPTSATKGSGFSFRDAAAAAVGLSGVEGHRSTRGALGVFGGGAAGVEDGDTSGGKAFAGDALASTAPRALGVVGVEDARAARGVGIVGAAVKHAETAGVICVDRAAVEHAEAVGVVCVERAAFEHAEAVGVVCVEHAAFEHAKAARVVCVEGAAVLYAKVEGAVPLQGSNAANLGWGLPLYRSKEAAAGDVTDIVAYSITSAEVDAKGADGEASTRRSGAAKVAGAFSITAEGADGEVSARRSGAAKVAGACFIAAKGADGETAVRARRSGHLKFAVLWRPSAHFAGVLAASAQCSPGTALCLGGLRCFSSGAGDADKKEKVAAISCCHCVDHFHHAELYSERVLGAVQDATRAQSQAMIDMRKANRANLIKHAAGVVAVVVIVLFAGGYCCIEMFKKFRRESTDYVTKIPARIAGAAGSYTMDFLTSSWEGIVNLGDTCKEGIHAAGDWIIFWRRLKEEPVLELEKVPSMELGKIDIDALVASLDQKRAERKAREQAAEEKLAEIMRVWFIQYW